MSNPSFYLDDIEKVTKNNQNFRQVVFTGKHMQLVLMTLKTGEEIGVETHHDVDQFFRVEDGEATVVIEGVATVVKSDMAFIVPAGAEHNVINTGKKALKLYTIYAPSNHPEGTIHQTKAEADAYEKAIGH